MSPTATAKIITDTNLLTVDKYGAGATIAAGEVGSIGGKRLILSDFMTSDLAASGLYTGAGSLTSMLMINLARFRWLRKRGIRVTLEVRYIGHVAYLVASVREGLHTFDSNSIANVRLLVNLSAS